MSDVAERVKKIVVEHLNVDGEKVTEGASFIEDLGADSLDSISLSRHDDWRLLLGPTDGTVATSGLPSEYRTGIWRVLRRPPEP